MFLLTFLNRRSTKSHWSHSLREIRMSVGNVSDDKRFSFGGTARAVLRARRRGPRLAEAGRTRTNSRLESRCRDASVRTRARAGCLACLPSASFEVCPFSFLYYCNLWRAAIFRKYTRATATHHRYRCNFIIVFDWRYDVTKNVRTFSISTSGDSMNSLPAWHLNVIVDARALSIADTRFDCRLWQVPIMLARHSELCATFWYKRLSM